MKAARKSKLSLKKTVVFDPEKLIILFLLIIIAAPVGAVIFRKSFYNIVYYYSSVLRFAGLMILLLIIIRSFSRQKDEILQAKNMMTVEIAALAFMMLWMLVSCFLARNPVTAFVGDWRGEGYISYIGYFAVYLGVYSLSDKKIFFRLWRLFSFVSYIVSIIGIISYSGVFYIDSTTAAMSSVFVNGNHFGYYLAVAFIASAYHYLSSEKTEKALHFAGLCLVSFSYIVSRCRGAWIGGALALIFFIIILLVQKKYKPISVFVPVFVLLFSFAAAQIIYNTSFNRLISIFRDANSLISSSEDQLEIGTKRWLLWTGGMKLVFIRPFFGFGLDNVGDRLKSLSITHTNRVHNEYLQYILSIGLVGAFAYFVFLLKIIIACLKNVFKISFISLAVFCAALAYLVSAFFGNTTPYVTPLFFMLMGWLSRHMRDFKQVN